MTISSNGNSNGNGRRHDPGPLVGSAPPPDDGLSGRRFLIVAGIVFLAFWGLLFLVFRQWRARYRERAAFGMARVVPAVDPLAEVVPTNPAISRDDWTDAVHRTHAMLETVVGSNLLDLDQMKGLRAELDERVKRSKAHPETAVAELAAVWDNMADRASFLLTAKDRHPRPKILPTRKSQGRSLN